jgi:hypothetical protein
VSLRWFERGRVILHPREVTLERSSFGLQGRRVHRQVLRCQLADESLPWELPLEMLRSALAAGNIRDVQFEIVLSGHFVRYALVPWSDQVGRQERQAYLRHYFVSAYGEAARGWDLRMCEPQPDENTLASGVEPALLEALRQILGEFSCNARAVHPYLMIAANTCRRHAPRGDFWLAVTEADRLCLAHLAQDGWKSVRQHALQPGARESLFAQFESLLARESMLGGDLEQSWPVLLHGPLSANFPSLPGRQVIRTATSKDKAAGSDENYRQALWA